jgi:hypothetical protein
MHWWENVRLSIGSRPSLERCKMERATLRRVIAGSMSLLTSSRLAPGARSSQALSSRAMLVLQEHVGFFHWLLAGRDKSLCSDDENPDRSIQRPFTADCEDANCMDLDLHAACTCWLGVASPHVQLFVTRLCGPSRTCKIVWVLLIGASICLTPSPHARTLPDS